MFFCNSRDEEDARQSSGGTSPRGPPSLIRAPHYLKTKLILSLFRPPLFSESPIIVGLRGGVPLGNVVEGVQGGSILSSSTDNYVVGPTLGVRLPLGFSVAADALVTNLHFSTNSHSVTASALSVNSRFWYVLHLAAGHCGRSSEPARRFAT